MRRVLNQTLKAFEHWQQTHVRQTASHPALLAGIMGLGCGIGVRKMARISSQVTEGELEHTVNWRFSLDNIRAANDAVLGRCCTNTGSSGNRVLHL